MVTPHAALDRAGKGHANGEGAEGKRGRGAGWLTAGMLQPARRLASATLSVAVPLAACMGGVSMLTMVWHSARCGMRRRLLTAVPTICLPNLSHGRMHGCSWARACTCHTAVAAAAAAGAAAAGAAAAIVRQPDNPRCMPGGAAAAALAAAALAAATALAAAAAALAAGAAGLAVQKSLKWQP
eukprot:366043-Chlamydomonas_euryale.AAC.10